MYNDTYLYSVADILGFVLSNRIPGSFLLLGVDSYVIPFQWDFIKVSCETIENVFLCSFLLIADQTSHVMSGAHASILCYEGEACVRRERDRTEDAAIMEC